MAKRRSQDAPSTFYRVLIVDDSAVQRKMIAWRLKGDSKGFTWLVTTAENGEMALEECRQLCPDVVIIDEMMQNSGGQMLGHEVVAHIRHLSRFKNAVVIGCSDFGESTKAMFSAGCDAVWNKPIPAREEAISQILEIMQIRCENASESESVTGSSKRLCVQFENFCEMPQIENLTSSNASNHRHWISSSSKSLPLQPTEGGIDVRGDDDRHILVGSVIVFDGVAADTVSCLSDD